MFLSIAGFEFRYQLKNPVFWVTSVVFFLLTYFATVSDSIRIGASTNVHKNAPFAIDQVSGIMCVFGIFTLVAFVAGVVVRDDDTGFGAIIRSTRVTKFNYLLGRFTGAFAAGALAMTSVQLGVFVGSLMPWIDPDTLGPLVPAHYLYAYFVVALPTLLLVGCMFFALATVTRSMMATYVGAVTFLILFFTANVLFSKPQYEHIVALLDPFGIGAMQVATKYSTVLERNTQLPALNGLWLYNRLLWSGVALTMLGLAYALFSFERVGAGAAPKKLGAADTARPALPVSPIAPPRFTAVTAWAQFTARARIDMVGVLKSPAFFVLLALGLLNSLGALWSAEEFYGNGIYPVTRAMITQLRNAFTFMPVIIAIYYAGELVWRDRDRKIQEIIDATPVADWMYVLPKILALFTVLIATLLASVVTAVLVQTIKGYPHYEFGHYLRWYLVPEGIFLLNLSVLAIFVQGLSPVKYAGWGIMGLYVVATIALPSLGYEDNLYLFNGAPLVPLSDMNGQGQYWIGRAWFQAYWLSCAAILALLSHLLWRRGTEQRLRPALGRLPARLAGGPGLLLMGLAASMTTLGVHIFHNTHGLNEYRTARATEAFQAEYEKALFGYIALPQPSVVNVTAQIDLYPHQLMASAQGSYTVENRTGKTLDHAHLRWYRDTTMTALSIDGGTEEKRYDRFNYVIFKLSPPMAPGERRHVHFTSLLQNQGFTNSTVTGGTLGRLADNGTFLNDQQLMPQFGMSRDELLEDRVKRRKFGLPDELHPPKLEDDAARAFNPLRRDSDWVTLDITVSTAADQIPIAPGRTVSDVTSNGRRTRHFVSDVPIMNLFSVQSAAYQVAEARAGDVNLAVYYDAAHPMNVQRMLGGMQTSLEVLQKAFSPYQFKQARILEFPGYATFAESFANTVPFSETIGFIVDVRDPDNVDMVSYVTAHELGHQWWAHQVMGADKQGEAMLTESFAQYSAMLVMEHMQGPDNLRKFLHYELNSYLRARGAETVAETPLNRVEEKGYIHYNKGAVAMWFLRDQLGEDVVNRAMRDLIRDYAFKPAPYPDTRDFIRYLRQEAGPGADQIITDTLEKITLYDVNVRHVVATPRADGKFDVAIEVDLKKLYADGYGKETAAPMAETFDVGLFSKEPGKAGFSKANVMTLQRMMLHDGRQTIRLVSDAKPAFGGVDPYNKRITRNADSVIAAVE